MLDAVIAFDAELYVEGHTETVMPRADAVELLDEIRDAGELVSQSVTDGRLLNEAAALAAAFPGRPDRRGTPTRRAAARCLLSAGRRTFVRSSSNGNRCRWMIYPRSLDLCERQAAQFTRAVVDALDAAGA